MTEPTAGGIPGPGPQRRDPGPRAARVPVRGRRFWQLPALLAVLPVAALTVFRAVPAPWPAEVEQLLAFTPWLILPAAAGLLFAVLGRRAWTITGAAALLAVQLSWLFPPDLLPPADQARAAAGEGGGGGGATVQLKVMNLNARLGMADAAGIVRLVRDNAVELLTIQEHTPALQDRLAAEGIAGLLPHRISRPVDGAAGSAFYSLHPMQPLGALPESQFHVPTVRLTVGPGSRPAGQAGGEPERTPPGMPPGGLQGGPAVLDVTNVHAQPPVAGSIERWRSDLAAIGTLTARPGNLLLSGDFNATYDHSEFRRILQGAGGRPMVDVATARGSRLVPTWPMDGQLLPGVVIDHLVTTPQVQATAYSVHRVAGTDHAALLATLSVPAAR